MGLSLGDDQDQKPMDLDQDRMMAAKIGSSMAHPGKTIDRHSQLSYIEKCKIIGRVGPMNA